MSASPAIKPPEIELNTFASGMIAALGAGFLLIPSSLGALFAGLANWIVATLGLLAYAVSLSIQIVSIMPVPQRRIATIRSTGIFFLLLFAGLLIRAGYAIEGAILLAAAMMQTASFGKRLAQANLLRVVFILSSLSGGLYLWLSGDSYAQIAAYKPALAIMFFAASLVGIGVFVFSDSRFSPMISRLQAVPWLAWCAVFVSTLSFPNLIAPFLLVIAILFDSLPPWERLVVAEENLLSRRIVMVTATLLMALLIFLSAALVDASSFPAATRAGTFLFFGIVSVAAYSTAGGAIAVINGIMAELTEAETQQATVSSSTWGNRLARYIRPFAHIQEKAHARLALQSSQIASLELQLKNEKNRSAQLALLMELSQQLENQLDQPVAAQLAVNSLERALNCPLVSLYVHEADRKEFMLLAAAGRQVNLLPHNYRQKASTGVLGRAMRQRKTQVINDIHADADYIRFENEPNLSAVIVPLIFNGHVNGALALNSEKKNAFGSVDTALIESAAAELARAWERSNYHQRLMNLVQAGSQLSATVEPSTTTQEVASIAREILQAKFTFVHIQLGRERNIVENGFSGNAPRLLRSLEKPGNSEALIQRAFHAAQPFRVRDVRKYSSTSHLILDNTSFRSMLAIPIRWHRMNIGAILAFGKQNGVFFSENDQSLAELLSIQAAGAFESTWLQEELRSSLRTTSLLYRLSNQIIQAENLPDAATDIARTAHKLAKGDATGIVLFNSNGTIATKIEVNSMGVQAAEHPAEIVRDALNSGQTIYLSRGQDMTRVCLPIQTPLRKYGALWMDIPETSRRKHAANPNDLQALASQAAIALERSLLLAESRRQALEIQSAYDKLEQTYDQTLASLMTALDARDRETEGHSSRVSFLAVKLGEALNFTHEQLKVLERGALLHDIGKIGISDQILHKPGPLSAEEWKVMRTHPDIGAKIVEGIPFLQDTIPLIRHHQERWNGTGYPKGMKGDGIPLLARMFAIVDAFDALTSERPYRPASLTIE
ncbi:MAG: GAF domain-containing protein, partial [Chloroflexi bacterium]|nr:GAF domain-containing protein [Chloroflexota bacterium]